MDSTSNIDDNIPDWFLTEVLIRIHPMLLNKFKLVSKQWLSIISDPYFTRRNRTFQTALPSQSWTIVSQTMLAKGSDQYTSHFTTNGLLQNIHDSLEGLTKPRFCLLPFPSTQESNGTCYRVYGVSNGLVLYGITKVTGMTEPRLNNVSVLYVCNPITGEWIELPPFLCWYYRVAYGFITRVEDGMLKSFRVVRLNLTKDERGMVSVEIFSSETGKWKWFCLSDEAVPIGFQRAGAEFNGVLHWITCRDGILAYDPYRDPGSKRLIAFPRDMVDREQQRGRYTVCAEYQGKLRLIEVDNRNYSPDPFANFKIWLLNDYSSGDWCLQHSVRYENIQYDVNLLSQVYQNQESFNYFIPICFHPFDSDLVIFSCDSELVSYSIKTRKMEIEQEFLGNEVYHMTEYKWWWDFLFTIPPWPVSIPHFPELQP